MFRKDLFIISQTWKQARCPSVDEWTEKKKDLLLPGNGYDSALKRSLVMEES
jgi:hypothetical protein